VNDKTVSVGVTFCISTFFDVTSRSYREDGFIGVTRESEGTPFVVSRH
jgi:hypothetical protein